MAVFLVYPTTMETLTRGKSLGKLVLGLRAVRDDARHGHRAAVVRPGPDRASSEIYLLSGVPAFFAAW